MSHKLSLLQQGKNFYRGKTITLTVGGTTGGGLQLYAIALQPYIASYLHATVNVNTVPAGGGVSGADEAMSAHPDGLTVGFIQDAYGIQTALTGTQYVNFNEQRVGWVEAEAPSEFVLVSSPNSPFKSAASLHNLSTQTKFIQLNAGSSPYLETRALFTLLGANIQYITGYPTGQTVVGGFQRGDAPMVMFTSASLMPLVAGGQATALLSSAKVPKGFGYYGQINALPTLAKVLQQYPPKSKMGKKQAAALDSFVAAPGTLVALQTGVAADKLAAMRAAVKYAMQQQSVRSYLLSIGQTPTWSDPVAAKATFIRDLKAWKVLSCYASLAPATTCLSGS